MKEDFQILATQGYGAVRQRLNDEQKELDLRRYILSVVYLGCELERVTSFYPDNLEITIVKLSQRIQAVSQREISEADMNSGEYLDDFLKQVKIDKPLENFRDGQKKQLYFNGSIKEQILDLLLTKEMKTIYLQASLDAQLHETRDTRKKKI